jgi:hypothetical protein
MKMAETGPQEGDKVRARGSDVLMTVTLTCGPDEAFHGIRSAVLCTWADDSGDREEVYPPSSLIVVQRASERISPRRVD